ncbi:MAG: endonuclease/exonuclease/phosphatase family protein, partial [Planctomycetales bacterium]|nr:endonuclease/exonuclease/phosphatase family protein [Planctomycetales bacterium]
MTWNVEWMFDDYLGDNRSDLAKQESAPSKEYWNTKVDRVAAAIAEVEPQIIALQEIEGSQTLSDIAAALRGKHQRTYRFAFIQGTDTFTEQDVGILYPTAGGLVSYSRQEQTSDMFQSQRYYNLSKHIIAEFRWAGSSAPLTVINLHLRATVDAEEPRTRQARLARHWMEPHLAHGEDVIVLGDFNSEHLPGDLDGDVGAIVIGQQNGPQLIDLLGQIPDGAQRTHAVLDRPFDRIYASPSLMQDEPGQDWVFEKIEILPELTIVGTPDGEA